MKGRRIDNKKTTFKYTAFFLIEISNTQITYFKPKMDLPVHFEHLIKLKLKADQSLVIYFKADLNRLCIFSFNREKLREIYL